MRPIHEERPADGGPEWEPDDDVAGLHDQDGLDEAERLRRARGALERLAGELEVTDEVLDEALDALRPPSEDGTGEE